MIMMNDEKKEVSFMAEAAIPEGAHFLLAFLNTRYGQQKRLHDAWPDHAAMEFWLREQGLITDEVNITEGDYRRAIALREALRQSLRRVNDATSAEALETLNHLAQHTLLKVYFTGPDQVRLVAESGGVDGIMARLLGDAYTTMWVGSWARLKICQNSGCSRAFYDSSKNRAGVWCATQGCGNRMRARTYRQQKSETKIR